MLCSFVLLLAVSLMLGSTACGGDSADGRQATAAEAAPAGEGESQTFTSKRYGYRVEVPTEWLTPDEFAEETEGEWDGVLYPLDPGVDTFSDPQVTTRVFAAARRVRPSMLLNKWAASIARGVPSACGNAETNEEREVAGAPAVVRSYHCTDGYYVITVAAVRDSHGFAIGWASPEGSEEGDRARFERILDSLAFRAQ